MNEILDLTINEMPQTEFECSCGRRHNFSVNDISIRPGAINDLPEMAEPFKEGNVVVVSDSNTYKVAGKKAAELLKESGFDVKELMFETGDDILIPDETTLGRILQEQDLDTSLMVAVGSGVLNDSVKYVTSRTHLPYIIVATAPSQDGYVSDGAPIISEGYKYSPVGHLCYGLIGDSDILATAPQDLVEAGYADIIAKITALTDWDLAVKVKGDYYCETTVELTRRALDITIENGAGIKNKDPEAMGALMEGLTLTGVAMALINISRPSSGAEHMLSHYWEMAYIDKGENPIHHGWQTGVATAVIARFFELTEDILPEGTKELCPSPEKIRELLALGGAPTTPKEIGISRELFHESLLNGYKVRPRYSVMEFAHENGRLEEIADQITKEIYN
jgi:glycerol-1-phosphate dehydrogenase [NAD(P)+]